ncbi:MAG: cadherin-like beta sandwich domain-containing protein [Candidatus Spechtbacterales bacterium]
MTAIFVVTVLGIGILAGAASADSISEDFEAFTAGSPNGQSGWVISGGFDVEIVEDHAEAPVAFGSNSLRISNATTSGSFGDQLFSASLVDEAGEATALNNGQSGGTRQNAFVAEWSFASTTPDAEQSGLSVTVSPDRGDGARMSYIRMFDDASGLNVQFYDVQGENAGFQAANFVPTLVAGGLDRSLPHSVRLEMTFPDGSSNDRVLVYVDGVLVHTGTSWENYFVFDTESQAEGVGSRTVDSLLFRVAGTAAPGLSGEGLLIDNLSMTSSTVAVPAPTTLYVDPSWSSVGAGQDPDGAGPATWMGLDAFAELSDAMGKAVSGNTIHLVAGTFSGDLTITTPNLTLTGAGVIQGRVDVNADGFTADGVEITNPTGGYGFVVNGVDGFMFTGGNAHDVGTSYSGHSAQAVYLLGAVTNATVMGNTITNVGNVGTTSSNKGVFVGDSVAADANGVTISGNTISGVTSSRGAYGVLANHTVGTLTVSGNTISGLSGLWVHGIGLEGDTPNASVTGNDLSGLVADGDDEVGVFFEANPSAETVTVMGNRFSADLAYGVAIHPDLLTSLPDLQVTAGGWWGHIAGPEGGGAQAGPNVVFTPWCVVSDCSILSNNANLTALSLSAGTLSPAFNSSTTSYTASVGNSVTSVTVNASAQPGANVSVSGNTALGVGNNTVIVTVTSADSTTKAYTITVTRAAAPAPPAEEPVPAPAPQPTPALTSPPAQEPGGITVPVTNPVKAPVQATQQTEVQTSASNGSSAKVTVPSGALPSTAPANASVQVAAVADPAALRQQAPPPAQAQVIADFVVNLVDENDQAIQGVTFDQPVQLEFTLPADQVPAGSNSQNVVLAFWNGSSWVEVDAAVTVNADGSFTIRASVNHFTLFSVFKTPAGWGTLSPTPYPTGVSLAAWGGGGYTRLHTAMRGATSVWVPVDGTFIGYIPGAPTFANAKFFSRFPDGIAQGELVAIRYS